ncbi:hypothetical protein KJ853_01420 [Patescibacteria group bacterium]|nr:hypothetical protein [Patescibacteria group bacterium]
MKRIASLVIALAMAALVCVACGTTSYNNRAGGSSWDNGLPATNIVNPPAWQPGFVRVNYYQRSGYNDTICFVFRSSVTPQLIAKASPRNLEKWGFNLPVYDAFRVPSSMKGNWRPNAIERSYPPNTTFTYWALPVDQLFDSWIAEPTVGSFTTGNQPVEQRYYYNVGGVGRYDLVNRYIEFPDYSYQYGGSIRPEVVIDTSVIGRFIKGIVFSITNQGR